METSEITRTKEGQGAWGQMLTWQLLRQGTKINLVIEF